MDEEIDDAEMLLHGLKTASDGPSAEPPDALRDALLLRTSGIVRRRSRARRLRQIAIVAAAYAAGLATTRAVWRDAQPAQNPPPSLAAAPRVKKAAPAVETPEPRADLASLSPAELRRMVPGAPRAKQIRLLQLAGDGYLYGAADVDAALDCYRQVLELTPPEELGPPDPHDSWLLAELKLSAAE
ncbi:MAG TPA: hypothetical protein VMV10_30250 [Pirellulales bacterium]|nr:hypothetical protein [Pirellulales bacterium]